MRQKIFLQNVLLKKKKSKIQGYGIFTEKLIPEKREFYIIPTNNILNHPTPRCAKIASNIFVNDPEVLNWINHSCEPNSEIVLFEHKVFLKSKRKINPGEEITVDYCETEEKNNLINCNCGTKTCRNYFFIS